MIAPWLSPPERPTTDLVFELVAKGMFPRELPGCFSTKAFAQLVRDRWSEMPLEGKNYVANHARHDIPKAGGGRRTLGVPNPISHLLLAVRVASDWPALRAHLDAGPTPRLAATRPMWWGAQSRALVPRYGLGERWKLRMSTRAGSRYVLFTDIAQFYPSIYSHSIPWVLSSKVAAKRRRRDPTLLGNELDRLVRNGQDQQTVGLPIGPDTSLLVAECILKSVDERLCAELPKLRGFRFIDDYELAFATLAEAERARGVIANALREVELHTNESKTFVAETPCTIDETWPMELTRLLPKSRRVSDEALREIAAKTFELASLHPADAVMKRSLMSLRNYAPTSPLANEQLVSLALNGLSEPLAVESSIGLLVTIASRGGTIDKTRLREVFERSLKHSVHRLHSHEVVWLLWAAIAFKLDLSLPDGLEALDDDTVALLALHGEQLGRWTLGAKAVWASWMTGDELHGRHWLVAYEAAVRGWLPHTGHVASDPHFSYLEKSAIRFYLEVDAEHAVKFAAFSPMASGTIGAFYA